jgi:membrane-bound lytic murein transglycosylase D
VILAMTIIGKNAPEYGLDSLDVESSLETDSIEVQTPTHLGLIADAVDRPLSELKDLNPGLLKSVAPAGFTVHVPKGALPAVETAFAVVPPNKRDAWRLHRVIEGDSFAALAKRYSAQTISISQVNHEALPEAGALMAIPVAYPGDRAVTKTAAKKASAKTTTVARRHTVAAAKPVAKKTSAVAQKSAGKAPVRHTAAVRTPNS